MAMLAHCDRCEVRLAPTNHAKQIDVRDPDYCTWTVIVTVRGHAVQLCQPCQNVILTAAAVATMTKEA